MKLTFSHQSFSFLAIILRALLHSLHVVPSVVVLPVDEIVAQRVVHVLRHLVEPVVIESHWGFEKTIAAVEIGHLEAVFWVLAKAHAHFSLVLNETHLHLRAVLVHLGVAHLEVGLVPSVLSEERSNISEVISKKDIKRNGGRMSCSPWA